LNDGDVVMSGAYTIRPAMGVSIRAMVRYYGR